MARLRQLLKLAILWLSSLFYTHTRTLNHGGGEKGSQDVRTIDLAGQVIPAEDSSWRQRGGGGRQAGEDKRGSLCNLLTNAGPPSQTISLTRSWSVAILCPVMSPSSFDLSAAFNVYLFLSFCFYYHPSSVILSNSVCHHSVDLPLFLRSLTHTPFLSASVLSLHPCHFYALHKF